MLEKILIILSIVPLFVINSFCDKIASTKEENRHNRLYNTIKFLVCSVALLPITLIDSAPKFGIGAIVCGIGCGVMYAISKTVILKGYQTTSVAFMTLCHAAGMILPCILGHLFWNEKLSFLSVIGIILAVFSIALLSSKEESKVDAKKGIIYGVIVFLTSGGVMIVQKLMGLYFINQSITAYNLYSFITAFIILRIITPHERPQKKNKKVIFIAAGLSAISLSVISLVMTKMAGALPSVIMFPLFNGLGIIFVCLGSTVLFKEKFTTKKTVGLILGLIGLFFINL